jgi:hypothetical protein
MEHHATAYEIPSVFISYAWADKEKDILSKLEKRMEKEDDNRAFGEVTPGYWTG